MQNYPLGINHLNQLVEHKLGHDVYKKLDTIYRNLPWLFELLKNKKQFEQLVPLLAHLDNLVAYLNERNKEYEQAIKLILEQGEQLTVMARTILELQAEIKLIKDRL